jgi:hypothetical protein
MTDLVIGGAIEKVRTPSGSSPHTEMSNYIFYISLTQTDVTFSLTSKASF